jgi:hypothetical protein
MTFGIAGDFPGSTDETAHQPVTFPVTACPLTGSMTRRSGCQNPELPVTKHATPDLSVLCSRGRVSRTRPSRCPHRVGLPPGPALIRRLSWPG